jgi:hypothetical protein
LFNLGEDERDEILKTGVIAVVDAGTEISTNEHERWSILISRAILKIGNAALATGNMSNGLLTVPGIIESYRKLYFDDRGEPDFDFSIINADNGQYRIVGTVVRDFAFITEQIIFPGGITTPPPLIPVPIVFTYFGLTNIFGSNG